jgi:hypothetical protein
MLSFAGKRDMCHTPSAGATTPKAGTAFVANAAREMRAIDIVRIYEEGKADLQVGTSNAHHAVPCSQGHPRVAASQLRK